MIGYDYLPQADALDPAKSTVTAMFVADRYPETTVVCGSCGASLKTIEERASTAGTRTHGCRSRRRSVVGQTTSEYSPGENSDQKHIASSSHQLVWVPSVISLFVEDS